MNSFHELRHCRKKSLLNYFQFKYNQLILFEVLLYFLLPLTSTSAAVKPHLSPQSDIQSRRTATNTYRLPLPINSSFKAISLFQSWGVEFSPGEFEVTHLRCRVTKNTQSCLSCLGQVWVMCVPSMCVVAIVLSRTKLEMCSEAAH